MEKLTKLIRGLKNLLLDAPMQEVKSKMIDIALPIFAEYDRDRRNFFSTLATMSATIGAFSFLLFNSSSIIKNQSFLKWGDILLLVTIILSVVSYLYVLANSQYRFHEIYYNYLENFNAREYDKLPKYKRPEVRIYLLESIVCSVFIIALLLIGTSFV